MDKTVKTVKIRPLMDGNLLKNLLHYIPRYVKIRPLMDGNSITSTKEPSSNVKIRPLMDGNFSMLLIIISYSLS